MYKIYVGVDVYCIAESMCIALDGEGRVTMKGNAWYVYR